MLSRSLPLSALRFSSMLLVAVGCGGSNSGEATSAPTTLGPKIGESTVAQAAVVAAPFAYDASCAGRAFSDPKGGGLTYSVTFTPAANGLTAAGGRVSGVPQKPGVTTARIIATDVKGDTASQTFTIVAFAAGLQAPTLPATSFSYSDAASPLPAHFLGPGPGGPVIAADNTPATNRTTDAGATLGRVLFHDVRLSANDSVSCSSCHIQAFGFSDTARFSAGINGGRTTRHAMALANARFYARAHFFWDERAATLEDQVLQPIQNPVEMGLTLQELVAKVSVTPYYAALFRAAFGTADVSTDRISRGLAQYVRSIVSAGSRYDGAFAGGGPPNFGVLTPQEQQGQQIFATAGCGACHATNGIVSDDVHNTGLDATVTDVGAGGGRFKAPSLRNVAVRGPYMHDGRFPTLDQVVGFYDRGVQPNPNLDGRLRGPGGAPRRLNLDAVQRNALVAFLGTLTDPGLLTSAKHADPFPRR